MNGCNRYNYTLNPFFFYLLTVYLPLLSSLTCSDFQITKITGKICKMKPGSYLQVTNNKCHLKKSGEDAR